MTAISMDQGREEKDGSSKRLFDGVHPLIHSQVRRVREEDLRIGVATGEGMSARDRGLIDLLHLSAHVHTFFCSRTIRPSSPLGTRTAIDSSIR